ncbi:MAG: carboxypeptidase, partial [Flavobacteriaceae bacterium]
MKIKALFLATLFASVSICWSQTRTLPVDTSVTTKHKLTTQNDSFNYTATTGTQPVWDENGDPIASLHYTYYTKDNVGNRSQRPLVISFNGGPGSGSVWMHLAYTGPRVLNIDTEGYPVQPYGIANNPYSILDVADIVYVNPVNTGYSRTIPASGKEVDRSKFFGVNADIAYLAEWLNTFVTRNNRWSSPKYLIGESYGTTRVSGLALALQNNQWMYLNGVILVSPTELGINREGPVEVANRLPYFAAAAWYQKKLPNTLQNKPLKEVLEEVEAYTINTVLPAMVMGGFLATDKKEALAEKMGYYSGIKPSVYLDHNLEIPYPYFW